MKTITLNIYEFSELSETAKKTAIKENQEINFIGEDYWESVYQDALETAKIKINSFDTDYRQMEFDFVDSAKISAESIIENHGENEDSYRAAVSFLAGCDNIQNEIEDDEDNNLKQFKIDLKNYYLKSIITQYEYCYSDEGIIDTFESLEMEFLENGKEWKDIK